MIRSSNNESIMINYREEQYFLPYSTGALIQLIQRKGGGAYISPMIYREKTILPNSICTPIELPKIGLHKKQVFISKNKKMVAVKKKRRVRYAGQISSIFCIFYLFTLEWLLLGQIWS